MSAAYDLVAVGRPSLDVMFTGLDEWPRLGNDIETDGFGWCAGASFNTPAAANRVGLRAAYVATVGNDAWSRMIQGEFEAEGLSTEFLSIEDRSLAGVSVSMNLGGDRGFLTHWEDDDAYGERLAARALEVIQRVDARHLHLYVDEMPEVIAAARQRGISVSLDSWDGPRFYSTRPLPELVADADVLFANETEATAITGETRPERALKQLAEHCGCVAIRRGADGAIGAAGEEVCAVPADRVEILDTTGAGDAFNAGFLRGWLDGLGLEASLTLGVICGSRAVGDYGGYRGCPREPELREVAAARGIALRPRGEAS